MTVFLCLLLPSIWGLDRFTSLFQTTSSDLPFGRDVICDGLVDRPAEFGLEGLVLFLDLSACREMVDSSWSLVHGRVRLAVADPLLSYSAGDMLRFRTKLRQPKGFQNGDSDFLALYFRERKISGVGFVADSRWILKLPFLPRSGFSRWIAAKRGDLYRKVYLPEPAPERGLLLSLLIGERRLLGPEGRDLFQKNGVSHLLAISGLHVGMVAFFFLLVLRSFSGLPVFSRSIGWLRCYPLAAVLPVWFYVVAAGSPVSAVRAAVMSTCVLAMMTLWRQIDFLNLLSLAAILVLLVSPLSLFSPSFQLSFVAVLFLILFFEPKNFWRDLFLSSGLVLLGLAPFLLHHFNELSLMGLFINAVAIPWVTFLLLPIGLLGWLLTGFFGLDVSGIWEVAEHLSGLLLWLLRVLSPVAEAMTWHDAFGLWKFPLYFFPFLFFRKHKLAVLLGCVAIILLPNPRMNRELKITFLDVGQGDSIVLQLPNRKVWVIDGGGIRGSDYDIGRFVIAPYLWNEGIRRVDRIFLTHPHHDHYKGLGFVARHFGPEFFYFNGDAPPEGEREEFEAIRSEIEKSGVTFVRTTRATPVLEEGEVRLGFLMPGPEGPQGHFDVNDNSLVMQLTFRDVSVLFAGDLMALGEKALLETGADLKGTVLKLGHHGSDTSTGEDFLRRVAPGHAVMSLGEFNSYGMPGKTLLERLDRHSITLYRTDRQGGIEMTTDGEKINFTTFSGVGALR